jgi:hypothetical protein
VIGPYGPVPELQRRDYPNARLSRFQRRGVPPVLRSIALMERRHSSVSTGALPYPPPRRAEAILAATGSGSVSLVVGSGADQLEQAIAVLGGRVVR